MISVSNVSMRYGAKVLFEDVSTAFTPGKRYGLTGPNGAGKSTFMKLLSGELEPQKGSVVRPKKLSVLSQDQFAFDAYRVIDTVIMGNKRLWAAMEERDRHLRKARNVPTKMACVWASSKASWAKKTDTPLRADAAILLQGLDIPDELHERKMGEMQGGQKVRVLLAQALFGHPQALLLDEPTNHLRSRLDPLAAGFSQQLRRRADRHLARPPFPEQRLHAHRRHRLRNHHHLHRRLRRHGDGQDADSLADRRRRTRSARRRSRS